MTSTNDVDAARARAASRLRELGRELDQRDVDGPYLEWLEFAVAGLIAAAEGFRPRSGPSRRSSPTTGDRPHSTRGDEPFN